MIPNFYLYIVNYKLSSFWSDRRLFVVCIAVLREVGEKVFFEKNCFSFSTVAQKLLRNFKFWQHILWSKFYLLQDWCYWASSKSDFKLVKIRLEVGQLHFFREFFWVFALFRVLNDHHIKLWYNHQESEKIAQIMLQTKTF